MRTRDTLAGAGSNETDEWLSDASGNRAAAVEAPGAEDVTIKSVSAEAGKAVAWRYKYRDCLGWLYQDDLMPVASEDIREVQPLYASPTALPALPAPEWQPIETAPKGKKIIVSVPNGKNHKPITMMGRYWPRGTLPVAEGYEDEDWAVEVNGEFYMPEGWYEECEVEDAPAHNIAPTLWQPLPIPPAQIQASPQPETKS